MKNLLKTFVLIIALPSALSETVDAQNQYTSLTTKCQKNEQTSLQSSLTPSQIFDVYTDNTR